MTDSIIVKISLRYRLLRPGRTLGRYSCAFNFAVAIVMVDAQGGVRQAFPAAMLVLFGAYLSARGAGRYSVDRLLLKRAANGQCGEQP